MESHVMNPHYEAPAEEAVSYNALEPPVDFYGGPFSNFVDDGPITIRSEYAAAEGLTREYPTSEHFFAACKVGPGAYPNPETAHNQIRLAPGPGTAKAMGRRVELRADWEEIKYEVMLVALRAKFTQSDAFQRVLLATGDRLIREDSPSDFVWGFRSADGQDAGRNLLGRALMQVRRELQRVLLSGRAACVTGDYDADYDAPLDQR
jgi:ribA/ribD-fused uncharacterized protein